MAKPPLQSQLLLDGKSASCDQFHPHLFALKVYQTRSLLPHGTVVVVKRFVPARPSHMRSVLKTFLVLAQTVAMTGT